MGHDSIAFAFISCDQQLSCFAAAHLLYSTAVTDGAAADHILSHQGEGALGLSLMA